MRKNWRTEYLRVENKIRTSAPIRYGRISKDRNSAFSLVFSQDCNSEDKIGKAFFVPFRNNPISFDKLKIQTTELIKSECKKKEVEDRFNWSWGTLAIALNPKILLKDSDKYTEATSLLNYWKECYGNRFNPDNYKVGQEIPILNKEGVLSFTWTDVLKDYDFLIATATKPNIEVYPNAKEIADRIIINRYSEYFDKNIEFEISTFQDKEINEIFQTKSASG